MVKDFQRVFRSKEPKQCNVAYVATRFYQNLDNLRFVGFVLQDQTMMNQ